MLYIARPVRIGNRNESYAAMHKEHCVLGTHLIEETRWFIEWTVYAMDLPNSESDVVKP
jgi:hypothetical protein